MKVVMVWTAGDDSSAKIEPRNGSGAVIPVIHVLILTLYKLFVCVFT